MKVGPGQVRGSVAAPPSKSLTIRACVAAALARGTSTIVRPSACLDAEAARGALAALGAEFTREGQTTLVRGVERVRSATLQCGESALCMRMLAPVAALHAYPETTLQGQGSLLRRPMGMLVAPLRALGAECTTNQGCAPVRVRGSLSGGHAVVDASTTSQLLTGLLFALPLGTRDSHIEVPALSSRGYVEMTLQVLEAFGIRVEHDEALSTFRIPGGQRFIPAQFTVEGDWSAAAFLLVAGAVAGQVELTGLRLDSRQADARVVSVVRQCGAQLELGGGIRVSRGDLRAFRCDVSEAPDLLPPLVVLSCFCQGTSELVGIERARLKESDRVAALHEVLGSLGACMQLEQGRLRVTGGPLRGGIVDSRGDHRIAMAAAVAALRASEPVEIHGAACVAKSYPSFFEDLEVLQS